MIHIYCGDGKGKTTAAVGLTVRMSGYAKKRALFIQFLKGSPTGELVILEEKDNIKVLRSEKDYGFYRNMSEQDKTIIKENYESFLNYAAGHMDNYDMIVLDEIFPAYKYELVDRKKAEHIVLNYGGELVLTGRDPSDWFTERADYISEINKIKHPFDKGITAREGIEF